jgi:hypothetical protein
MIQIVEEFKMIHNSLASGILENMVSAETVLMQAGDLKAQTKKMMTTTIEDRLGLVYWGELFSTLTTGNGLKGDSKTFDIHFGNPSGGPCQPGCGGGGRGAKRWQATLRSINDAKAFVGSRGSQSSRRVVIWSVVCQGFRAGHSILHPRLIPRFTLFCFESLNTIPDDNERLILSKAEKRQQL